MFDIGLTWFVVIAPTLFAIGIELVKKELREDKRWRVGILIFGFTLSVLTALQIMRADKAAKKDRDDAIDQTSKKVAASVSDSVTASVTQQYQKVVADQKKQISDLQEQLAKQGRAVSVIKSSNIVTGKKPIKVEVTNQLSSSSGAMQVENIRVSWQPDTSTHSDAAYAKKLIIQADAPVDPVKLAIFCDTTLKYGEVKVAGPYTWYGGTEIYKNDSHVYVLNMSAQGTAVLRPDAPLIVYLYSDQPFNILRTERGSR